MNTQSIINSARIDSSTMIIIDFWSIDKDQLWRELELFMADKAPASEDSFVYNLFLHWAMECNLDENQSLVAMSTLFPMRVMQSLINSGFYAGVSK